MSGGQVNQHMLPDEVQALFFVCDCFGLGLKDFADHEDETENLCLSREKLRRARVNKSILPAERERVRQRLFQRLRHAAHLPTGGMTSFVTHELATLPLELYGKIRPRLQVHGIDATPVMWVLANHFFVPTLFHIVQQQQRWGLGTELRGVDCWYVPRLVEGRQSKPIQQVLDCWLRVAGFKTAYGVTQLLIPRNSGNPSLDDARWKSWKKSVERWLDGERVGSLKRLHRLVGAFAKNVTWLDHSDAWKARFTLAYGMQNLQDKADQFFAEIQPNASLQLAKDYRRIALETHYHDDEGVVNDPRLFFAVRLIVARLEREGRLAEILAQAPQQIHRSFGPKVPSNVIEEQKARDEWERNPANWLIAYIQELAINAGRIKPTEHPLNRGTALREYIFDWGVDELNERIAEALGRQRQRPVAPN